MKQKVGIIWNPTKAKRESLEAALGRALTSAKLTGEAEPECLWFETTPDDGGQAAAGEALNAGCTIVIAAGGDGTVGAVADRLGHRESGDPESVTLGIVPLGTGNLLARNLGIPLINLSAAFRRALTGDETPLDVGELTVTREDGSEHEHRFIVMVGFGLDAQMIVETDEDLKSRAGWLAYVESLGRVVSQTEIIDFTLTVDDEAPVQERAHTLLLGNCGTLQGGVVLLPDAVPGDGKLDMLMLRADGFAPWLDTMRNMMWENGVLRLFGGKAAEEPATSSDSADHVQAQRISAQFAKPVLFEVDGDDIGEVTSFTAHVLPGAVSVR